MPAHSTGRERAGCGTARTSGGSGLAKGFRSEQPSRTAVHPAGGSARAGELFPDNLALNDASVLSSPQSKRLLLAPLPATRGSGRLELAKGRAGALDPHPPAWHRADRLGWPCLSFPSCELRLTVMFGGEKGQFLGRGGGCLQAAPTAWGRRQWWDAAPLPHDARRRLVPSPRGRAAPAPPAAGFIRGPAHVPGTFPTLGLSH